MTGDGAQALRAQSWVAVLLGAFALVVPALIGWSEYGPGSGGLEEATARIVSCQVTHRSAGNRTLAFALDGAPDEVRWTVPPELYPEVERACADRALVSFGYRTRRAAFGPVRWIHDLARFDGREILSRAEADAREERRRRDNAIGMGVFGAVGVALLAWGARLRIRAARAAR